MLGSSGDKVWLSNFDWKTQKKDLFLIPLKRAGTMGNTSQGTD
jgi:hypothetical protein